MKRKFLIGLLLFFLFRMQGSSQTSLEVGPGPEDMVVDSLTGAARLLVSCAARREGQAYFNEIRVVDAKTQTVKSLPRTGEPPNWRLHFHGMDIVRRSDGRAILCVISHGLYAGDKRNFILVYELMRDSLRLIDSLHDAKVLRSPNDVMALPDGRIYASNDYGYGPGMILKSIFRCRASSVALYDQGRWTIAAKGLRMANGLCTDGKNIYVSETMGGTVLRYEADEKGLLRHRFRVAKGLNGIDNLCYQNGWIVSARHPKPMAFMKHRKDPKVYSPTLVFRVNATDGTVQELFSDPEKKYSAASTAFTWQSKLWMSQVFDSCLFLVSFGNP